MARPRLGSKGSGREALTMTGRAPGARMIWVLSLKAGKMGR